MQNQSYLRREPPRRGQIVTWLVASLCCASAAGAGIWHLAPCEMNALSHAEYTAELDVPYQEVRTLLVRNEATKAVIEQDGMEIINEEVLDLKLDFSKDKRPLLNALFGKSKSNITAKKRIVVAINNQDIQAKNLVLIQDSKVTTQGMSVKTNSENPAGDLTDYSASLFAVPNGDSTSVKFVVEMKVCKNISSLLHSTVQSRLDSAAHESVQKQYLALREFVEEHKHK